MADDLRQDARFALRWLARSPRFTTAVLMTLMCAAGSGWSVPLSPFAESEAVPPGARQRLPHGVLASAGQQPPAPAPAGRGVMLEHLPWPDAEARLTPEAIIVLPLGAGAVEHGPHLTLGNDLTMTKYLAGRVIADAAVVVAPVLTYHAYPAVVDHPGSTSLSLDTARAMTTEIVRSLARVGPRRFYVLNAGHSPARALEPAAQELAAEGILLRFTELEQALEPVASRVRQQDGGTHADEIETSMMLYIDPGAVNMSRAVKKGGIRGDPTLATRAKGQQLVEHLVTFILSDVEALRSAPLPPRRAPSTPSSVRSGSGPGAAPFRTAGGCTEGDERAIRRLGDAFTLHWSNGNALELGGLWTPGGDIFHPDGTIERTRVAIVANRTALFRRREYRHSKHPVSLMFVKCIGTDVAVADGNWELRGVTDAAGKALPTFEGQVTLVVRRGGDAGWQIDAYRYSMKPQPSQPPALLKQPGWPDR